MQQQSNDEIHTRSYKTTFSLALRLAVCCSAHTGSMHGVFQPTTDHPASQYFDSVQRGSVAANAGLKTGDFLLEVRIQTISLYKSLNTLKG